MKTKAPIQYSRIGRIIKLFLHTKIGARIGFFLGIRGFNCLKAVIIRANGKVERLRPVFNARVNKGADLTGSLLFATTFNGIVSPAAPKYIALSTSTITPAAGDTTLDGETSASGMGRALGTVGGYVGPSVLDGAASNTVTKTFTATGNITINSAALFDASSGGNLFVEANLSQAATLANQDTLQITWTVNY